MRISDWSSDVCSSDLREQPLAAKGFVAGKQFADTTDQYAYERKRLAAVKNSQSTDERLQASQIAQERSAATSLESSLGIARPNLDALNMRAPVTGQHSGFSIQSEEPTSELQSLMRISSAA